MVASTPRCFDKQNAKRRSWGIVIAAQLIVIGASFIATSQFLSSLGRFDRWPPKAAIMFVVLASVQSAAILLFGLYRRSFRYAGIPDLLALAKSVGWSACVASCLHLISYDVGYSLSSNLTFILVDSLVLFLLLTTLQFNARLLHLARSRSRKREAKRVLIVGAGDGGASVARELLLDLAADITPVAFVDDDPNKHGGRICGVPVTGGIDRLEELTLSTRAAEILVCIPSADASQMSRILAACRECGIPVRTLPSVSELLNGQVSWRDLRSISVEDVLQRKTIEFDQALATALIRDKVVLVTGAGGSIGSELCRQVAAAGPQKLVLIDKSENSLFYSHLGITEKFPEVEAVPCLVDVTSAPGVREVFVSHHPAIVLHAAAFKHVGMMELHPHEAVRNNVLGTLNVALCAAEFGVTHFVNISTDKAVNPTSYMGLSKQIAEQTVRDMAFRRSLRFMNVRFGNVAGSTGSVVRLFLDQIAQGGPLRVTDPRATRYFMSIPEAVYLILCAASLGQGGETFIFDMGEPINIYQLARTMSLLAGYIPEEELPIEFIGLRDGEKVHEELREEWEEMEPTVHPQLFTVTPTREPRIDIARITHQMEQMLERRNHAELLDYIDLNFPRFANNRMSTHTVIEFDEPLHVAGAA